MQVSTSFSFSRTLFTALALSLTSVFLHAGPLENLLKKGDGHDVKFQASSALPFYLEAEKIAPNDTHILLRIARQYRHLMADAATVPEKVRLGNMGLAYAQKAAQLAPGDSEAQLSTAISYGKMIDYKDKGGQIAASIQIKQAAELAVKLDPRNDSAWHVLGRWHRTVSDISSAKRAMASMFYQSLPSSSNLEALKCLQKAVNLNPARPMHYIELGIAYIQCGNPAAARQNLEKGLALPNRDKDDDQLKAQGKAALAKLN